MRILLALAVMAVTATAEPPPQAAVASAPAVTVADAQALPAVTVVQVDTAKVASETATTRVDTGAALEPSKKNGHGLGFWLLIAAIVIALIAGVLAWRYVKRTPPSYTATSSEQGDTTRMRSPGSSGRRND